jgi:hypothetical protein
MDVTERIAVTGTVFVTMLVTGTWITDVKDMILVIGMIWVIMLVTDKTLRFR